MTTTKTNNNKLKLKGIQPNQLKPFQVKSLYYQLQTFQEIKLLILFSTVPGLSSLVSYKDDDQEGDEGEEEDEASNGLKNVVWFLDGAPFFVLNLLGRVC